MTDATQTTGPISMDDVRRALGDTDPAQTNASKLRAALGRGSFATIQKHLETLRTERAPAAPVQAGATPAAPADALAAIWSAAWQAAQVQTLGRLEAVTNERDSLTVALATTRTDVEQMAGEVDSLTDTVSVAQHDLEAAKTALTVVIEKGTAAASVAADALAAVSAELSQVNAAAAHAQELAKRDASIAASAMQSTIDRLTDQVSELKSLLHKQAT